VFRDRNQGAAAFNIDIQASEYAIKIVQQFNQAKIIDKVVKVNLPELQYDPVMCAVEPYIDNWIKFNSNTGWQRGGGWAADMAALSHYSYHISSGQFLLCDLQGGEFSNGVIITDPVIMSMSKCFGPTDLGHPGIRNFFAYHECTKYCSRSWKRPRDSKHLFEPRIGSTMDFVPSFHGLGKMTNSLAHMPNLMEDSDYSDDEW